MMQSEVRRGWVLSVEDTLSEVFFSRGKRWGGSMWNLWVEMPLYIVVFSYIYIIYIDNFVPPIAWQVEPSMMHFTTAFDPKDPRA